MDRSGRRGPATASAAGRRTAGRPLAQLLPQHGEGRDGAGQRGVLLALAGVQHQVLPHGERWVDAATLGNVAQPAPGTGVGPGPGDVLAVQEDRPGRGPEQAGRDAQQGGLTGPVRPEHGHHGARRDGQRDVAEHRVAAVTRLDPAQLQHRGYLAIFGCAAGQLGAEVGGADRVAGAHVGRGALEDLGAEVQHVHVVADVHHQRHVVLHQEDADVPFRHDPGEYRAEAFSLRPVEAGRRLVEQQDVELPGQAAGQLDQPPLAGGQRRYRAVGQPGDPGQRQGLLGGRAAAAPLGARLVQLPPRPAARPGRLPAQGYVLPGCQRVEQLHLLEGAAQSVPGPGGRVEARHVRAVQPQCPAGRPDQAGSRVEQRGLARAIGPDQPGDPADRGGQAHVSDRDMAAVPDCDMRQVEAGDGVAVGAVRDIPAGTAGDARRSRCRCRDAAVGGRDGRGGGDGRSGRGQWPGGRGWPGAARAAAADPVERPVQPRVARGEAERHLHRGHAEQHVQPVSDGRAGGNPGREDHQREARAERVPRLAARHDDEQREQGQ